MWQEVKNPQHSQRNTVCINMEYGRISIPARSVKAFGLNGHKACRVYRNDDDPHLIAIQPLKGEGQFVLTGKNGQRMLSMKTLLEDLGAQSGKYHAHRESSGMIIVDLSARRDDE